MFYLKGQLINLTQMPEGTRKDGTAYGGDWRVQIQHENIMKNGNKIVELLSLPISDPMPFKAHLGKTVQIPVSPWAKGGVNYQIASGTLPNVSNSD